MISVAVLIDAREDQRRVMPVVAAYGGDWKPYRDASNELTKKIYYWPSR